MPKNNKYVSLNLENAESLRAKIRQEAEDEIKDILTIAKKRAKQLLDEAKAQAAKDEEKAIKKADKEISALKEQLLCAFNVEKKRIILEEKNNFIEAAMALVKQKAENFRTSRDYPEFLTKAIVEAILVTDELKVIIFYSPNDEDIFNEEFIKKTKAVYRNKTGKEISLEFQRGNFNDIGILAQSADARLMYDNRFLARLKRGYDDIYMQLLREMK